MIFFRKPVATFRDRALADSHKADAQFPSPLVGEDRLGRRPSEEGGAGHRAPGRSRPAVHQPQGQGPRDPSGPAPAADGLQSLVGKALDARRPPPRSAFGRVGPPHKGEEGRLGSASRSSHPPSAKPSGGGGGGGGGRLGSLSPPPPPRRGKRGGGGGWGVVGRGEGATRTTRGLGRGPHRQPPPIVDEAPGGSPPPPAGARPESAPPATRFAS